MIAHHFKLAKIYLLKNGYYTSINIFGLVCGTLSALIIAKYIGGSLEFDGFHANKHEIYSISQQESLNGGSQKQSNATYAGTADLAKQFPEVVDVTRYSQHVESLVKTGNGENRHAAFIESRIFIADSGFLKIFTFPLIFGDAATALSRINSVILTRSTAQRYFGDINPIGKTIIIRVPWGAENIYEITGVVQDIPPRSQFKFDFLIAGAQLQPEEFWYVPDCSIFVLLRTKGNPSALQKKLSHALGDVVQLRSTNRKVITRLNSFATIRLTNTELLLAAVGVFVLVISWVNYLNQIIVQSYWRIKDVGIRRVMGATRANLRSQFLIESTLMCLISLLVVICIYLAAERTLQSFTNGHLLPLIADPTIINFSFLSIFILGIASAAVVPAIILFSQNFGDTLRNGYSIRIGSANLRKGLIVLQFSISTILMISIFVISRQLQYMRTSDKGIGIENILIVKSPMLKDSTWGVKRKYSNLFKTKCAALPHISEVTSSTSVPGEEYRHETYLQFKGTEKKALVHLTGIDEHFFSVYDAEFVAGHDFIPNARWQNANSIILTESAVKALNVFNIGDVPGFKIVDLESNEVYDLIGIIKDYHQTSLKYEIKPMAFKFNESMGHYSLRLNTSLDENQQKEQLESIREIWREVYHDADFDSFFLQNKFEMQDAEDRYFGELFKYFTILSVIIPALGLFGLSLLVSEKRRREIGIRKTFGASSANILVIFLKNYIGTLGISVLIGLPVAYALMNSWLQNFSYRVGIEFWAVASAVLSLTLIFMLVVSYSTIRSALANPVIVLRE